MQIPAGATALDFARLCHSELRKLQERYAKLEDRAGSKARLAATLGGYARIIAILEERGETAGVVALPAPATTYDVARARKQYVALCKAIGQDAQAASEAAERVPPPASIVSYWHALADGNRELAEHLEGNGLSGLLFRSDELYDDEHLSDEAADIAESGELLHAVDADAWYVVDGTVFRVHPEGASEVGDFDACMRQLREELEAARERG